MARRVDDPKRPQRVRAAASACFVLLATSGTALAAASDAARKEAAGIFATRCAPCHGATGKGDGAASAALIPKPRDFGSDEWQASVTDEHLMKVITLGGPAAGKSPLMPPNPDIAESADLAAAFVEHVRALGGRTAGATPAEKKPASTPAEAVTPAAAVAIAATPEQVHAGQEMFQGRIRFANGGPACNSCHDVKNDAVIGGGVLAKELTSTFSTMGGAFVTAVLGQPPFPVMEQAYRGKELTQEEIAALIAFLQEADAQQAFQQPRDYGLRLFVSGFVGFLVLMVVYSLVWARRKTRSVNDAIYARQVRTT